MPVFHYEAIDATGKIKSGTYAGDIIQNVETWLIKNGLSPIDIRIVSEKDRDGSADRYLKDQKASFFEKIQGVKLDDLILLCNQVATMLNAGVDVLQTFKIMAVQLSNPYLRQIMLQITDSIESGDNLSDSFSRYPRVFNQLFQNVIRIGEESGNLDNSFSYLATLYENEKEINERIKEATRYPKIVITAIFAAVFFLMSFVVPKFVNLFSSSKVALPMPTRILITISNAFAHNWVLILFAIAICAICYKMALNYEEFVLNRDRLILRIPIFGNLSTKIYMARFCRVFSVLTKSGIDIIKTISLSATALENLVLFNMMKEVGEEVEEGVNLHEAMARHPQFPSMVVQMVAVGEESGQIDTMMAKVADYYDLETNYTIKNLSTLIEPILLLFLGVMVGFIALAIFLPMWNLMSVFKG
jgi:type II secretory pathway component PulF